MWGDADAPYVVISGAGYLPGPRLRFFLALYATKPPTQVRIRTTTTAAMM